jgi:hypothetical protein
MRFSSTCTTSFLLTGLCIMITFFKMLIHFHSWSGFYICSENNNIMIKTMTCHLNTCHFQHRKPSDRKSYPILLHWDRFYHHKSNNLTVMISTYRCGFHHTVNMLVIVSKGKCHFLTLVGYICKTNWLLTQAVYTLMFVSGSVIQSLYNEYYFICTFYDTCIYSVHTVHTF